MTGPVLALDVGGTKLAAAVIDESATVLSRERTQVPDTGDGDVVLRALVDCAHAALAAAGIDPSALAGVGVACAGPMDPQRSEVSPLNIPAWRGFPLAARLEAEWGLHGVRIENDAVAIAAGESWAGAGRGVQNLLAVTVSTGVGGGLVLDGRLHYGATHNAGHIGHLVVDTDGPLCACGGHGCLEAIASGPRTVARALAAGWIPPPGAPDDGVALADSAQSGDPIALAELATSGRALGVAFASAAALLDLELILVVGGFSHAGEPLWTPLRQAFDDHAGFDFVRSCRIEPGALGDDAGLLGAAALVLG